MYTGKVEDLERRRWNKDGCGKGKKKDKSRMGINPAKRPGIRTQRKGEKTFVAAHVRYVMGRVRRKSREDTCP